MVTSAPNISLLRKVQSSSALIIKPRFILVEHKDDLGWPPFMSGLSIHKNIPISDTKLTLALLAGFIGSHLIADKLFLVNPRTITGPPKITLLLKIRSTLALIIKPMPISLFCR